MSNLQKFFFAWKLVKIVNFYNNRNFFHLFHQFCQACVPIFWVKISQKHALLWHKNHKIYKKLNFTDLPTRWFCLIVHVALKTDISKSHCHGGEIGELVKHLGNLEIWKLANFSFVDGFVLFWFCRLTFRVIKILKVWLIFEKTKAKSLKNGCRSIWCQELLQNCEYSWFR